MARTDLMEVHKRLLQPAAQQPRPLRRLALVEQPEQRRVLIRALPRPETLTLALSQIYA